MALRNAFEELATEATLDTVAKDATLDALAKEATTAKEDTLTDVKRSITDYEVRLDYDVRTDGNPVYVGKAPQGALTSNADWTVQLMEYDASNRLVRVQVLSGIVWDNRAAAGWS